MFKKYSQAPDEYEESSTIDAMRSYHNKNNSYPQRDNTYVQGTFRNSPHIVLKPIIDDKSSSKGSSPKGSNHKKSLRQDDSVKDVYSYHCKKMYKEDRTFKDDKTLKHSTKTTKDALREVHYHNRNIVDPMKTITEYIPAQSKCNCSKDLLQKDGNVEKYANHDDSVDKSPRNHEDSDESPKSHGRYDPGVSYFNSIVIPVNNLELPYETIGNSVQFRMRRKNKTVFLQWEPFSGIIAASGIAFLTVTQSIWNLPPYPVVFPIYIRYRNVQRFTHVMIDPNSTGGNIKFFLGTDDSNYGDVFEIYAGCVNWIVD